MPYAVFFKKANFGGAKFSREAQFLGTEFSKEAEFEEARMELFLSLDTTLLSSTYDPVKAIDMKKALFTLGETAFTQYDFAVYFSQKQKRKINNT